MQSLWSQQSNTSLGTFEEEKTLTISLPVLNRASTSLISGNLPGGLRLDNNLIVGTPYEIARDTDYRFVIRANYANLTEDRTFTIKVLGQDDPFWITPEGDLPVGNNNTYYILDSSPIDFQLVADDDIIELGGKLNYYIAEGDGQLPPGTSLTEDGRIVGIVDPLLAIERGEIYASGSYDTSPYDLSSGGFDFGVRNSNGFDSFYYDTTVWDFSYSELPPKKLNRYYEFIVSVTDGNSVSRRVFKIFVVGDDFFRADNTVLQVSNGVFTADNSNLRTPIWITPADLGIKRANNYITIPLDVIDTNAAIGFINYNLETTNFGTYRLISTGETIYNGQYEISGILPNFIDSGRGPNSFTGLVADPVQPSEWEVIVPETASEIPTGMDLDTSTGDIAGRVPYQAEVVRSFSFTIKATRFTPDQIEEQASSYKTFTLRILGEIDSQTSWITESNLGTLASNALSVLRVEATTNVPGANVLYSLSKGRLPPGLELNFDGEIVGTVSAFGEGIYKSIWKTGRSYKVNDIVRYNNFYYKAVSDHTSSNIFTNDTALWVEFQFTQTGLTVFDKDTFLLDSAETSIDREYKFTVAAEDQYKYSIVKREFVLKVLDPEITKYSNLHLKPLIKQDVKQNFVNFLSDPEVFIPETIYRPGDPNFGIQKDLKIPLYYGIETKELNEFIAAMSKNHKKKKYIVGDLKTAVAKTPGTNDVIYEVVYLDIKDPARPDNGRTKKSFRFITENKVTTDIVSFNPKNQFYDYETLPSFVIATRNKGIQNVTLGESFTIETRGEGIVDINWISGLEVDGRTEDNLIKIIQGLANINQYRPQYANVVSADSDAIKVSGSNDNIRYISNIDNMRDNIRSMGLTNRSFVPLWMRTTQADSVNELGYTPSIVLCYCKPGTSARVKAAIDASGYDFSNFNLEIDRYTIDSSTNTSDTQYLLFANYRYNI